MATEIVKSLLWLLFFSYLCDSNIYPPPNEKHEKDILTDFRDLVNCSGAGSAYVETDDL